MLLENVKGLLSHDGGKTFETMCAILNDIGYAIDFAVLNSKYFGVPQNRERIFIVCDRDADHSEWNVIGTDVVAKAKRRIQELSVRTFNFEWPAQGAVSTRLRDILESIVDERYYLSEEKTARLIAQLRERELDILRSRAPEDVNAIYTPDIVTKNQNGTRVKPADDVMCALTVHDRHGVVVPNPIVIGSLEHYGNDQMNRVYSVDGVAPTCLNQHGNAVTKIAELQQFSDGSGISYNVDANYAKGTSVGDIGGGRRTHVVEEFTVIQKTHSTCTTVKYDETGTLQAARLDKVPQAVTGAPRYRIRKLTPRECWRLQGFTDAQHDAAATAGVSDSQRYKQAGNAVTVNVISAIGRCLIPLLNSKTPEVLR